MHDMLQLKRNDDINNFPCCHVICDFHNQGQLLDVSTKDSLDTSCKCQEMHDRLVSMGKGPPRLIDGCCIQLAILINILAYQKGNRDQSWSWQFILLPLRSVRASQPRAQHTLRTSLGVLNTGKLGKDRILCFEMVPKRK